MRGLPDNEFPFPNYVRTVAWSPDGKRLATGATHETVGIWDAGSGEKMLTLPDDRNATVNPRSIAWSPDGKRLATASYDNVAMWDTVSGQELLTLRGHNYSVNNVAWAPMGSGWPLRAMIAPQRCGTRHAGRNC